MPGFKSPRPEVGFSKVLEKVSLASRAEVQSSWLLLFFVVAAVAMFLVWLWGRLGMTDGEGGG